MIALMRDEALGAFHVGGKCGKRRSINEIRQERLLEYEPQPSFFGIFLYSIMQDRKMEKERFLRFFLLILPPNSEKTLN